MERSSENLRPSALNPTMTQRPGPNWIALLATRRDSLGYSYSGNQKEYRRLRLLGATPIEAMDALLAVESAWEKAAVFGQCCPARLGSIALVTLLRKHSIHPLSVAIHYLNRRSALRFLQRVQAESFGTWLGTDGCLFLSDPTLRALPPGLVLRGNSIISNCPNLEDLGQGLKILAGDLLIERCPRLRWLPTGFETRPITAISVAHDGSETPQHAFRGHLRLLDCPNLEGFGSHSQIRGTVTATDCPGLSREACRVVQVDPYQEYRP